jgi:methionyl-tRNA formyltransferase
MKKKLLLLLNSQAGIEVLEFLIKESETIYAIFIANKSEEVDSKIKQIASKHNLNVFSDLELLESQEFLLDLEKNKIDFLISVYWPWLLKKELLELNLETINFHPSLLPLNRGWYPHVHNIIYGSPAGVTLHKIAIQADSGDIWCQKEVDVFISDTASSLHKRLENEIITLFKSKWELIKSTRLVPTPQLETNATYNKRGFVDSLDEISLHQEYKASELINILRARTFGESGYSYFYHKGKSYRMLIRIEERD